MIAGGCLCGAVRYVYDGEPGPANYCHCRDCRRVTGSAFNVGVRLEQAKFRIERGDPSSFTKTSDGGNPITRAFCAECGSPLFTTAPSRPGYLWVKAGSLDSPEGIEPADQIWTDSAVPWAHIKEGLTGYPRNRTR